MCVVQVRVVHAMCVRCVRCVQCVWFVVCMSHTHINHTPRTSCTRRNSHAPIMTQIAHHTLHAHHTDHTAHTPCRLVQPRHDGSHGLRGRGAHPRGEAQARMHGRFDRQSSTNHFPNDCGRDYMMAGPSYGGGSRRGGGGLLLGCGFTPPSFFLG